MECGDESPLSIAATRRGESPTADESAVEKAGASCRTPKFGAVRPDKLFERCGRGNHQKGPLTMRLSPRPSKAVERNGGELSKNGNSPLFQQNERKRKKEVNKS